MPVLDARFPPSLTKTQSAARRRADDQMHEAYPGCYVAYFDEWNGDVLNRRMFLVAQTPAELQEKLKGIERGLRRKLQMTLIPDLDWSPIHDLELR